MRIYEELFIVRPDAPEEEIDGFIEQVKNVITSGGGTVDKVDKWGVRKLAYRVEKRSEGFYVLVQFTAGPDVVKEVERRMRVTDMVIKFISVRIDEKLKKLEKRTKQREKRAKRRPPVERPSPAASPVPAAPGSPVPASPAPGAPAVEAAPVVEAAPAAEAQE
ncbi:MAG: 30S ribosomal protein S6 [Acidobacteria bacterium]|nr:30S ribosomal protein S6 [Acidobacteriota bacterium]